ncbi:PREDICTED: cysteine-rich with EGF-like domain protein 1 isoform X2 [Hipposideros armiger]|uniref:Cysteine-rich with EGF-like domain protein 1 isoform X2 n=1 Tax=Hipposideros armiger TaxID=186990 RepID=A0A8B7S0U0_HIPAR|nr:PREDICTED: cysteine-rich with EGF-like domain protein 1 isoform X2 [Hipposideros armiger]
MEHGPPPLAAAWTPPSELRIWRRLHVLTQAAEEAAAAVAVLGRLSSQCRRAGSPAWEKMAPQPPRDLVPALLWGLSLFFSLPGPVWLQPSPLPQSSPPTEPHPCHTCRGLVDSFNKGLERTIRDNFGGGNTAWEEEKLSKYKDSETRLVEVLESVCSKSDFECHRLLELSEELVESWWFHKQQEAPDLFQWLCSDSLKLCCPSGTFGPSCLPCPGGAEKPCGGYGRCEGEGTRGGSGHCDCQAGYGGEACGQCGLGYFEAERNASHLVCSACFGPCARCSGPEESNCLQCKKGWALHHLKCVDIDECGTERANCGADQFCVNTEGSYECRDCAKACLGCMGAGPGRCKKCSPGYQQMWTSVRQRCAQERMSSARTQRAVTAVSVQRATNRLRASV